MEKFITPKLSVIDHYESVIREVDIFTEELLERYNENELLPESENKKISSRWKEENYYDLDGLVDPYSSKYDYDMSKIEQLDVTPGTTRVRDYLELVRSKAIEKLKQAEQETLDRYEENKDLYKYNQNELTDEKIEEMRRNLCKERFSFVLNIDPKTEKKLEQIDKKHLLFKSYTIFTDFYLTDKEVEFLKERFWFINDLDYNENLYNSTLIFDERILLLHMIQTYMNGLVEMHNYSAKIISISKSMLFEIDRIETHNYIVGPPGLVILWPKSSIDLSFLKSLTLSAACDEDWLFSIRDLSALINLEYLILEEMILYPDTFNGLRNLIKLEINRCSSYDDDNLSFDHLINLKFLRISFLYIPLDLRCLENLILLDVYEIKENGLRYLRSLTESINVLDISNFGININDVDLFISRIQLPYVSRLTIENIPLIRLEEGWFSGMMSLKELTINSIGLDRLDFDRFESLSQLEKLQIIGNKIEILKEAVFSKLTRLKWLDASSNPISKIEPNAFRGLKNLEDLALNQLENLKRIEKDTFNGLDNLKKLSLKYNRLQSINFDEFKKMPKLVKLELI